MTPIFILTCDRLTSLRESIDSYRRCIETPFEIVIVDFGTTYGPTTDYIRDIEKNGSPVYRLGSISHPRELMKANDCIQDYFTKHSPQNYVVTDPDIALDNTPGNILEVYEHLLTVQNNANSVGAMLRINDLPDYYPFKEDILSGRLGQHKRFHSLPVREIEFKGKNIKYIGAPIDTTFALYRYGEWKRLKHSARVLEPYGARHLDWYVDPHDIPADLQYYKEHSSKYISHWSNWKEQ